MSFSPKQIEQLMAGYAEIQKGYERVFFQFGALQFQNKESYEFLHHGFFRRMNILKRCIDRIYKDFPPPRESKPNSDELSDLVISLQSFIFNVYGCIDNLAWIWVKETNFKYKKNTEVSFFNKEIQKLLSPGFKRYLTTARMKKWFNNLNNFRHSLAHRIPLYVPPAVLNKSELKQYRDLEVRMRASISKFDPYAYTKLSNKQRTLGKFMPLMTHSFSENTPNVIFHSQIIADWNTIVQMADKFSKELESKKRSSIES